MKFKYMLIIGFLIGAFLGPLFSLVINPKISFFVYKNVILETEKNSPLLPINYINDGKEAPWSRKLVKDKPNAFYIDEIIVQKRRDSNLFDLELAKENPLAYNLKDGEIKDVIPKGGIAYYLAAQGAPYTYQVYADTKSGEEYIESYLQEVDKKQLGWWKKYLINLVKFRTLGVMHYKIHLSPEMIAAEKKEGTLIMSRHLYEK